MQYIHNFTQIEVPDIKMGKSSVRCKGKLILGENSFNMFYSAILISFPIIPFNVCKLMVSLTF